jgi:hypothetical protein
MKKGQFRPIEAARVTVRIPILPLTSQVYFRTIHSGVGVCQQFLRLPDEEVVQGVRNGAVAILSAG